MHDVSVVRSVRANYVGDRRSNGTPRGHVADARFREIAQFSERILASRDSNIETKLFRFFVSLFFETIDHHAICYLPYDAKLRDNDDFLIVFNCIE